MLWKREEQNLTEQNAEMNKIAKEKGEMLLLSGSIVSEGTITKKRKEYPTARIKTKRGTHTIVLQIKHPDIKVGFVGTIAVSKEMASISRMVKAIPKIKGQGNTWKSLVMSDAPDPLINKEKGNSLEIKKTFKTGDVYVRETIKEEYLKFQFIIP